jgi:hypothetical protein
MAVGQSLGGGGGYGPLFQFQKNWTLDNFRILEINLNNYDRPQSIYSKQCDLSKVIVHKQCFILLNCSVLIVRGWVPIAMYYLSFEGHACEGGLVFGDSTSDGRSEGISFAQDVGSF